MTKYEQYITRYANRPPERPYFEAVFDVLMALDLPKTKLAGFASMMMLEYSVIHLKDGRIIGHDLDIMGSIEDIACAISVVFSELESDPIWWKSRYPSELSNSEVQSAAVELVSRLRQLPIISNVQNDLK